MQGVTLSESAVILGVTAPTLRQQIANGKLRTAADTTRAGRGVLHVADVAELLGLHAETVRRHLATGDLPGRKLGGRWLVSPSALEAWLAVSPAVVPDPVRTPSMARHAVVGPVRPARSATRPPRRAPARIDDSWAVPLIWTSKRT